MNVDPMANQSTGDNTVYITSFMIYGSCSNILKTEMDHLSEIWSSHKIKLLSCSNPALSPEVSDEVEIITRTY